MSNRLTLKAKGTVAHGVNQAQNWLETTNLSRRHADVRGINRSVNMIGAARQIDRLEWFGTTLPAVVSGVPVDDARWKPTDGARSIVEIVRHLLDE